LFFSHTAARLLRIVLRLFTMQDDEAIQFTWQYRWRRKSMSIRLVKIASAVVALGFAANCQAVDLSGYTGEQLFTRFCASCHGTTAMGDGPVAPALNAAVPDLTRIAKRHGGNFPAERLHQIIDGRLTRPPHGTRTMPVWGWEFLTADGDSPEARLRAEELIGRMVEYLHSIQKQ
jgi:mono/diheme cytochrome c family protein